MAREGGLTWINRSKRLKNRYRIAIEISSDEDLNQFTMIKLARKGMNSNGVKVGDIQFARMYEDDSLGFSDIRIKTLSMRLEEAKRKVELLENEIKIRELIA